MHMNATIHTVYMLALEIKIKFVTPIAIIDAYKFVTFNFPGLNCQQNLL